MCQEIFSPKRRAIGRDVQCGPLPQAVEKGIRLIRIDPAQNMQRYYDLKYEQDLFGRWLLVRQWGRIGRSARRAEIIVGGPKEAVRAALVLALQKMKRGYRLDRGRGNYSENSKPVSADLTPARTPHLSPEDALCPMVDILHHVM